MEAFALRPDPQQPLHVTPFRFTPQTPETVSCDTFSLVFQTPETVTCDTFSLLPQAPETIFCKLPILVDRTGAHARKTTPPGRLISVDLHT